MISTSIFFVFVDFLHNFSKFTIGNLLFLLKVAQTKEKTNETLPKQVVNIAYRLALISICFSYFQSARADVGLILNL